MQDSCLQGFQISISCDQFRNPISQKVWGGFTVTTYDPEQITIDSSEQVSLNTKGYDPAPIPISATSMQLSSYVVADQTAVTLVWEALPIPLEKECFVELTVPPRLKIDFGYEIAGFGLFRPSSGDSDGILTN